MKKLNNEKITLKIKELYNDYATKQKNINYREGKLTDFCKQMGVVNGYFSRLKPDVSVKLDLFFKICQFFDLDMMSVINECTEDN